jgi:hypothetical protein
MLRAKLNADHSMAVTVAVGWMDRVHKVCDPVVGVAIGRAHCFRFFIEKCRFHFLPLVPFSPRENPQRHLRRWVA